MNHPKQCGLYKLYTPKCIEKDGIMNVKLETTLICENGNECNEKTFQCQMPDYSLEKCTGPTQPDVTKKETVVSKNKFGEIELYESTLNTVDTCYFEIYPKEDPEHKGVVEFWCMNENTVTTELFECPAGTTCKNGACS